MIALLAVLAATSLPAHVALHPAAPAPPPDGRLALSALQHPVEMRASAASTTFDIPFDAAQAGGIPRELRLHLVVHRAGDAPAALVDVRINGALIGARPLPAGQSDTALDVAVPGAYVGANNDLRVAVDAPGATLAGGSLLAWDGVLDRPATVADFFKVAHGRALVLTDPAFDDVVPAVLRVLDTLSASVRGADVRRYDGTVPAGYDEVLVLAPPDRLARHFTLPLRGGGAPFRIINPINESTLAAGDAGAPAATLQVGDVHNVPLLALSYAGDPAAIARLGQLQPDDVAVQVGNVALSAADGLTAYEVGSKLRVRYADDDRLARGWEVARWPVALLLFALLLTGGRFAWRHLTGEPA